MSSSHGKFVWYELMTTETKAAQAFYSNVVRWGARDAGMPGMSYTLFTIGEEMVAGLMELPDDARQAGARPGWTGYVAVDDVDASAARFAEDGGKVHRAPADIPGVGRFAIVSDPQGAILALFKPSAEGQPPPAAGTRDPGRVGWHELLAADGASAFDFYSKQFGWTKGEPFDMGAMGMYQLFAHAGQDIGGMMTKPEQVPAPFWLYYFNVDGIDAASARVRDGGGQIVNGPMEVPGGRWIIQCVDPQGGMFALLGPKA